MTSKRHSSSCIFQPITNSMLSAQSLSNEAILNPLTSDITAQKLRLNKPSLSTFNSNNLSYQTLSCRFKLCLLATLSTCFITLSANAVPPLSSDSRATSETTATAIEDPQVATPPASPFINTTNGFPANQNINNGNIDASNAAQQSVINAPILPNPLNDPATLASQMQPTDNALSQANQELLSRNAQLQRDINDLHTQVDVLVQERSGQLFMYGALTTAIALFLGFALGGFVFGRRDRW